MGAVVVVLSEKGFFWGLFENITNSSTIDWFELHWHSPKLFIHVETEPDSIKSGRRSRWLTIALREKAENYCLNRTVQPVQAVLYYGTCPFFPSTYKCVDPSRVRHSFQQVGSLMGCCSTRACSRTWHPLLPTVESHNYGVPHHEFTTHISKKIWCQILSKCEEKIEMEYFVTILSFFFFCLPDFEKEKKIQHNVEIHQEKTWI